MDTKTSHTVICSSKPPDMLLDAQVLYVKTRPTFPLLRKAGQEFAVPRVVR
jgi:hypothetical protein